MQGNVILWRKCHGVSPAQLRTEKNYIDKLNLNKWGTRSKSECIARYWQSVTITHPLLNMNQK